MYLQYTSKYRTWSLWIRESSIIFPSKNQKEAVSQKMEQPLALPKRVTKSPVQAPNHMESKHLSAMLPAHVKLLLHPVQWQDH
jgi:hypothetical protein